MSESVYQMHQNLIDTNAHLRDSVRLDNGTELASWFNQQDRIQVQNPDHHTLSLYVDGGYESFLKTPEGWKNGGGPDRMCLMPRNHASEWDIRGPLAFVHFYFTDQHLTEVAEKVWDKSPAGLTVDEHIFDNDPQITAIYRQFFLNYQWGENVDRMAISSAVSLLFTHLVKHYTQFRWTQVQVKGGLAPFQLARIKEFVAASLSKPLQLSDLSELVSLSEYHFARMFKQSTGITPHQYVMQQRLNQARILLQHSGASLTEIALQCGFSSSSHFSNRFKLTHGETPLMYRRKNSSVTGNGHGT
ncbi:HTH-type transcriptional activator RhaR [Vibrio aerogenes CECT 7868]|uniref:HTH-type transcriptional activator RhaR n=1 Tax=Vibrio aerogenes CECT 7868 TaxID=1216006 RepID=A0A1M5VH88_9VIBR|nr:helix-turn-helix domain-containing protein [Vibrio aerogenes]SHH74619.1 HTH-type transcriptional activator RhaR [Vibrio aerogenes CECT 7868]